MRAVQVVTPTGPADLEIREVDEPTPGPDDILIEVHRVGISFPDLLLSRGEYQWRPEPPFSLGVDVAGTVVSGAGFEPGQRVAGVVVHGGAQERLALPAMSTFPLPDAISAGGMSSRFMMVEADTDLPEPLSPRMARVSPRSRCQLIPRTASTMPAAVWNRTERFFTSSR